VNDSTFQVRAGFRDWTRHRGVIALCIFVIGVGSLLGWASAWRGATGVRWALLAVLICAISGIVSWFACKFAHGPQAALWTMLIGMGIRMTAALAACLVVNAIWRDGIHAGFGWYLVVAYLITLALDILFIAPPEQQTSGALSSVGPFARPRGVSSTHGERHG
jgi:hypothetical protein